MRRGPPSTKAPGLLRVLPRAVAGENPRSEAATRQRIVHCSTSNCRHCPRSEFHRATPLESAESASAPELARLLGLNAVGNIHAETDVPHVFAARREARLRACTHQTPLAVNSLDARLGAEARALSYGAVKGVEILCRVVWMHRQTPLVRRALCSWRIRTPGRPG